MSRTTWSTDRVPGQPRLHGEILSQKHSQKQTEKLAYSNVFMLTKRGLALLAHSLVNVSWNPE